MLHTLLHLCIFDECIHASFISYLYSKNIQDTIIYGLKYFNICFKFLYSFHFARGTFQF
jgi:hypothetical protein